MKSNQINRINLIIAAGIIALIAACSPENKSFKPGELWLDNNGVHINAHGGGILFHDDIYYWFGEHKTQGKGGNKANVGVHCYSSNDLYNWKDEGIVLAMHEDTTSLLVKGCILERPKVIYNAKTKKYVMWFHHELKGKGYDAAMTGVAQSDKVTGPYTYIKSVNPNAGYWPLNYPEELRNDSTTIASFDLPDGNKKPEWKQAIKDGVYLRRDFTKGQMARDMTLFVASDGKAYHIHASENNQTLHVSELNDDYTGFTGRYTRVLPGKANEAPALFEKDGLFYMFSSGCTGWKPNPGRTAVAKHPLGPWEDLGNPSRGDENQNKTTFHSQSTNIIPIEGKNAFIYMGDRWTPKNAIDGRYIWLPIEFEDEKPVIRWHDEWSLYDSNML